MSLDLLDFILHIYQLDWLRVISRLPREELGKRDVNLADVMVTESVLHVEEDLERVASGHTAIGGDSEVLVGVVVSQHTLL